MNILVLTNEYPNSNYPKKNSPWTVPYFAREWAKQGHNVLVVVNTSKFPTLYYYGAFFLKKIFAKKYNMIADDICDRTWSHKFYFDDYGVHVYNFPMLKLMPSAKFPRAVLKKQISLIEDTLNTNGFKPDVITGHWINPQLFLIEKLGQYYDCKTAFVFEGDFREKYLKKYNLDDLIHNINKVGCRSKYASTKLQERFLLSYSPFICVSGVPAKFVNLIGHEKTFNSDKIHIFSAGRLVGLKKFNVLINACAKAFNDDNYDLRIAGEGALFEELSEQIVSLNKQQTTCLLGKIPRDELFNHYERSDVFVLISENEAFGIVYLEAMSKGCIVVASRNGGIDGILIDGYNGFLCNAGDENELVAVLKKIQMMSLDEKIQMSKNAIKTATMYTDEQCAKLYLEDITR